MRLNSSKSANPPEPESASLRQLDSSPSERSKMAQAHLELLFLEEEGVIELRAKAIDSDLWAQHFHCVSELDAVVRDALRLSSDHEVYVGVLPRARRGGTRADLIADGVTIWADLDSAAATRRAMSFDPPPTLMLRSGRPGHSHAYWALDRPIPVEQIEVLNATVAERLGADEASVDGSRILRLAGTLAHKQQPPVLVTPLRCAGGGVTYMREEFADAGASTVPFVVGSGARVVTADMLSALAENFHPGDVHLQESAPGAASIRPGGHLGGRHDLPAREPGARGAAARALASLAPDVYVRALLGVEVPANGKVCCPLHDDRTPSLHVYPSADEGWFCFGCRRGGSVYDLAAALWKRSDRGVGFLELRDDLLELLVPEIR